MLNIRLDDATFFMFLFTSKASYPFDSTIVCLHFANQTSLEQSGNYCKNADLRFKKTFALSSTSFTLKEYVINFFSLFVCNVCVIKSLKVQNS